MRSDAESARIHLSLTRDALIRQLAALLDGPVDGLLEFAPALDVTQGYGRSLTRYLRLAISEFEQSGSILWNPLIMGQFEQFVMTGLLLAHPHNFSAILRRLERPITPRDVRRAIDYIHGNLRTPITLSDLVAQSGVAGRTLVKHFNEFMGTSPMRYIRNARLAEVRDQLRRAEPEEHVTEIATSWGFSHVGRFGVEYRKRFGESPSETRGRRRRRSKGARVAGIRPRPRASARARCDRGAAAREPPSTPRDGPPARGPAWPRCRR